MQAKRKEDAERYEEALATWKILERERDERVKLQRQRYQEEKDRWNRERAEAKQEGRKAGMAKPVLGPIEPKPGGKPVHPTHQKKATQVMDEDESEGEEMDEETSGNDSD